MKLNRQTAGALKAGDILKSESGKCYFVKQKLPVFAYGRRIGYQITVQFEDGRMLYLEKLSLFYDFEIITKD